MMRADMQAQLISITTALQRMVATKRIAIIRLFQATELSLVVFTIIMIWLGIQDYETWSQLLAEIGHTLGKISLVLYMITLTPGIISRLQWQVAVLQPLATAITPIRRHFGILTFLTAFMHSTFILNFHVFVLVGPNPLLWERDLFVVFGTVALLILFPLWLTSNDFSVRKLGRNWKRLHRITYIALFFIYLHVAFQLSKWSIIPLAFLILEIISWMAFWGRQKNQAISQPPKPQA